MSKEYAFPFSNEYQVQNGMSLRDWFAGRALTAIVEITARNQRLQGQSDEELCRWAADLSYKAADAMMAERKRRAGDE